MGEATKAYHASPNESTCSPPIMCAMQKWFMNMSHRQVVAQPSSLNRSSNLSFTACLDKRSLFQKHKDNRARAWKAREEKKYPTTWQLASTSASDGKEDRHPAVRTRTEKRQLESRWRDERRKEPSTTWCVQINTARPASNPDTLTLPPPTKTPRPRGGRKKNRWQITKKGENKEG